MSIKRAIPAIVILLFLAAPVGVLADDLALDAYKALRQLQARVQTGINYIDYGRVLGQTRYYVTEFLESRQGRRMPEVSNSMRKVFNHYNTAHMVWNNRFLSAGVTDFMWNTKTINYVTQYYPLVNNPHDESGAMKTNDKTNMQELYIDSVLRIIWREATSELATLKTMLNQ